MEAGEDVGNAGQREEKGQRAQSRDGPRASSQVSSSPSLSSCLSTLARLCMRVWNHMGSVGRAAGVRISLLSWHQLPLTREREKGEVTSGAMETRSEERKRRGEER